MKSEVKFFMVSCLVRVPRAKPMPDDLFRQELLRERGKLLPSKLEILTLRRSLISPAVIASSCLLSLAVAAICPYTQHINVTGKLQPSSGMSIVASPVDGIVSSIFVREASAVSKFTPLIQVTRDLQEKDAGLHSTKLAELELQVSDTISERKIVEDRQVDAVVEANILLAGISHESAHLEEQSTRSASLLDRFSKRLHDIQAAFASRLVSGTTYDAMLLAVSQLQVTEAQEIGAELNVKEKAQETRAKLQDDEFGYSMEKSSIDRRLASLRAEIADERIQREVQIMAPRSGEVSALQVQTGDYVRTGQSLATVFDVSSGYTIKLSVPSWARARVHAGSTLSFSLDAYPAATFGLLKGIVTRISDAPQTTPNDQYTTYYTAEVAVEASSTRNQIWHGTTFKPGLGATVSISLTRMTLLRWLWVLTFEKHDGLVAGKS